MPRLHQPTRSDTEQDKLNAALRDSPSLVWGYVRVSSDSQEEGTSLESQEASIRAYAKAQNLEDPQIVVEVASAGSPLLPVALPGQKMETSVSPRPLFLMLLSRLCELTGAHLIVWKLDRFARVAYEQEMLLELLRRRGVSVHSAQAAEQQVLSGSADSTNDPARVFFRQIMGATAQYERALIRLRMTTGLRMKASKGGWAGGCAPYGYDAVEKELKINQDEAAIVRHVFFMRDQEALSYEMIARDVAKRFNQAGWHKVRISRIIHNRDLYLGVYIDPFGGQHQRPDLRVLPESWTDYLEGLYNTIGDEPKQIDEGMPTYEP